MRTCLSRACPRCVVIDGSAAKVFEYLLLCVTDIPAFCIKRWDWLHMPK